MSYAQTVDPVGLITAIGGLVSVIAALYRTRSSKETELAGSYRELVEDLQAELRSEREENAKLKRQLAASRRTRPAAKA